MIPLEYRFINKVGEIGMETRSSVQGTDGVHAETKQRDPSFVMTGHHCHSCFELFYVQTGQCRFLIDRNFYDLGAGDFILIPPMVLHYTRYVFGSCVRTVILFRREDLTGDVLKSIPEGMDFFSETRVFKVAEAWRSRIEVLLGQMVEEEQTHDAYSEQIRKSALQYLMLQCCRVCAFLPGSADDIRTTDPQILKAARYINEHYMQSITTEDVAGVVGFSPNYLSRKFRLEAGIGLHEYLVFVRLHHAARELVSTVDSITAIALRCGFSDSNYFKDSFKKKYGVTPRN